jgi:adenylate kinase
VKSRLIQRDDDTAEKVKTRIKAFHENLNPLLTRYKDKTLTVDGNRKADNIWGDLYGSIARSVKYRFERERDSIVRVFNGSQD